MSIKLGPHPAAKSIFGKPVDAWWYESRHSISIHIRTGRSVASCKITRAKLADWIRRTSKD